MMRRPPPRELRDGRYVVDAYVAAGRWSEVYRGRDVRNGEVVALKRLAASPPDDPRTSRAAAHAYAGQCTLVGRLDHPQLVAVRDVFATMDGCWVVMDFVAGSDPGQRGFNAVMPWPRVVRIARAACAGLGHAAAAGVLHRDVKPANLLLDVAGRLRVTDFAPVIDGLADHAGTPAYFAPERLRHAPATVATDIYALGVVCYQWLTGRRPHEGATVSALARAVFEERVEPPSRACAGLPALLDETVLQALAADPAQRPESWSAFAAALDRCVESTGVSDGAGDGERR